MVARNVTLKLKAHSAIKFSRLFEDVVLPVLRKQPGFRSGVSMVSGERSEAVAISFWDGRESAEAFELNAYAPLVEQLESVLAEPPDVSTLVVSSKS